MGWCKGYSGSFYQSDGFSQNRSSQSLKTRDSNGDVDVSGGSYPSVKEMAAYNMDENSCLSSRTVYITLGY